MGLDMLLDISSWEMGEWMTSIIGIFFVIKSAFLLGIGVQVPGDQNHVKVM